MYGEDTTVQLICGEEMLKICTVYYGDRYTPDYVGKLYDSIRRNCSIPFQSICISDNPNVEADLILPYNHHSDIKKHWHKLKFFSPHFGYQDPGDDIIIMDIDQVITNNVDDLIGHPVQEKELITYGIWWNKWWRDGEASVTIPRTALQTNGGFYKFKSGSLSYVWDDFIENPKFWQMHYYNERIVHFPYYGEQNYVNWRAWENNIKIIPTPEEWIGKCSSDMDKNIKTNKLYFEEFGDFMYMDEVNPNIKVIHFTGLDNNIHNNRNGWIKDHWK